MFTPPNQNQNHPNQSAANEELIRKALAPPGSAIEPASNNTPARKAKANQSSARKTTIKKKPVSKPPPQDSEIFTSRIIDWDKQKGFGYLLHQKGKLFLHRNDFAERHKRPSKGDRIHYQIGTDPEGRRCAVEARHVNDGGKITLFTWIKLALLVAMPILAWSHFVANKQLSILYFILPVAVINLLTYTTYKNDKALARAKEWRTSEATLHMLELIGGWPAAFIAQRQFRHKCSKPDFTAVYWMIVLLHLYLAFDYLLDWRVSKTILDSFT